MAERTSEQSEPAAPGDGRSQVVYSTAAERDDETGLSVAVVETLAEARGVAPEEIDLPLYDVVDPDALDRLFTERGDAEVAGRVVFEFEVHEVTVHSNGDILVRRIDSD